MKAIEFVTSIRDRVIEDDFKDYQETLDTITEAKVATWKGILPIYKNLSRDQQADFLQFMRMVQVNALSKVLGILDGSSYLNDSGEDFVLKTKQSDELINGYLQDTFLEMEESWLNS